VQGTRSLSQYRAIDCSLFAIILVVFETVVVKAGTAWFPDEPWMVSVTGIITAIVMMRWGPWAAIHAVLGGIVLCAASGKGAQQPLFWVVYGIGNLGGMIGLLLRKKWGPEGIRRNVWRSLIFGGTILLGMQAGRALLSLILIRNTGALVFYFTPEVVTMLFTLVLTWIVRRVDGLFEDQRHFLNRYQKQMLAEESGNAEEKGGFQ
jgi:hypothetical protein